MITQDSPIVPVAKERPLTFLESELQFLNSVIQRIKDSTMQIDYATNRLYIMPQDSTSNPLPGNASNSVRPITFLDEFKMASFNLSEVATLLESVSVKMNQIV